MPHVRQARSRPWPNGRSMSHGDSARGAILVTLSDMLTGRCFNSCGVFAPPVLGAARREAEPHTAVFVGLASARRTVHARAPRETPEGSATNRCALVVRDGWNDRARRLPRPWQAVPRMRKAWGIATVGAGDEVDIGSMGWDDWKIACPRGRVAVGKNDTSTTDGLRRLYGEPRGLTTGGQRACMSDGAYSVGGVPCPQ